MPTKLIDLPKKFLRLISGERRTRGAASTVRVERGDGWFCARNGPGGVA